MLDLWSGTGQIDGQTDDGHLPPSGGRGIIIIIIIIIIQN